MIRFMASGYHDFADYPVEIMERFGWEIFVVTEGRVAPVFNLRDEVPLESEYIWIMPPQLAYGWRGAAERAKRYAIHFVSIPELLQQVVMERGYFGKKLLAGDIEKLERIFRRLEKYARNGTPAGILRAEKALLDLSLLVIDGMEFSAEIPLDQVDEQRVESALYWYRMHIHEAPGVEDAAAAIGLSAGHLRRLFKRTHGCNPHDAFMSIRMESAKSLLSSSSRDIFKIGRQCGFRSKSDFCRTFNRQEGIPPHRWRMHYARKEEELVSSST